MTEASPSPEPESPDDDAPSDPEPGSRSDDETTKPDRPRRRARRRRPLPRAAPAPPPRPARHGLQLFVENWRIPMLAALAVVVVAGTRFEQIRPIEATVIALVLPLVTVLAGALPMRDSSPTLRRWAFAVAALVVVGSELCIGRAFFPPAPFDEVTLSAKQPDATLNVPGTAHRVEVESRVAMGHVRGTAEGHYAIDLERDGKKQMVQGDFSRSGGGGGARSSRRAPQATEAHADDVDRQALTLPGSGPLHAHLDTLSGAVAHTLHVSIGPAFGAAVPLSLALLVLGIVAVGVEAVAMNRGLRSHFGAWVGIAIGLGVYMPAHFDPGDRFGAVLGGLVIAVLAGGGLGMMLGLVATRALGKD